MGDNVLQQLKMSVMRPFRFVSAPLDPNNHRTTSPADPKSVHPYPRAHKAKILSYLAAVLLDLGCCTMSHGISQSSMRGLLDFVCVPLDLNNHRQTSYDGSKHLHP